MLWKKSIKRVLSVVIVLCLLFSLSGSLTSAWAADGLQQAEATEQADATADLSEPEEAEPELPETTSGQENARSAELSAERELQPGQDEPLPEDIQLETTTVETEETEAAADAADNAGEPEETAGPESLPADDAEDTDGVTPLLRAPLQQDGTRAPVSTDLASFLTDVAINAPTDENGNYIIDPNSTYDMTFTFRENEELQFDDTGDLVYTFPEGLIVGEVGQAALSITVVDENGTAQVLDNIFEVRDGQLHVRFNQDDPNFERLKAMSNVQFKLGFSTKIDENVGEIVFNPEIVKDFVFEENADLTITKSVAYDMDSDTAHYVVQVTSAGVNENVVVEDHLTGTALTFNRDVTVESSVNGPLSVTPDYTAVDNGYQVTISQMTNGEVLTFRYSASVDNTKISSNGTVEQTNNTARVTSDHVPEGKEASADFAGQAKFQRVAKRADGEPVQIGENLYEQSWKIRVNEDHKMLMGGSYISDWILQNSRPYMQFTGDGITVQVTMENGTTETRVIPWSELRLYENSYGTYGWAYLTPESDEKASYEITCKTLINSSGALGDLKLVNGAQVFGSYDEGETTVGVIGENVFDIRKDAEGTTSTQSDWKITVTVPGSGLPDLRVTDDAPKLVYQGQDYIDYFDEGTFEVEGLQEGESWKLYIGTSRRSYTLTFYQDPDQTQGGVLPTPDGQPRDIVIRFKTSVNQQWLDLAAENGYVSSTLYRHRNYACAWSGNYRTPTVDATVIPIRPDLLKSFIERDDVEIDGVTYPVFRYSVALTGPAEDGLVIRDEFNTDYLRYYEADGVSISGGPVNNPTNTNGTAYAVDGAGGMEITVANFPKTADGSFYPYYLLRYSLIVKDEAALTALNDAAASSQTGVDLENTAIWDTLRSSRVVNYTYFPYVDKELVERPSADNGYVAEFKVIINKYAEDLDPTSDVLTILDELSANLRFLPDSLTISPANDAIVVQHDDATNTLIFSEVPDETTFEITYQARVLGSGNVTYSNTIKFGKFEKTVEETTTVDSSGGGTASNPSITLVKRDAENISSTLSGATFQLFTSNNGQLAPVRDRNGQNVTFTTGADGTVLIVGNQQSLGWTLWENRTYALVEVTAPAGYELNGDPTYFVLSGSPSSQMEYDLTGDQFSVQDTPVKISIPVTKTWIGPAGESVVVHLYADDADTGMTVTLTEQNNWTDTFENLRKYDETGTEIPYRVEEEPIAGYDPQYSGSAEAGFTVTNINTETVDIPVVKKWIGPIPEQEVIYQLMRRAPTRADTMPVTLVVQLLADQTPVAVCYLSTVNDYSDVFMGMPKYDRTDGHEIQYEVVELNVPDGYQVEVAENPEGGFIITNTNIETLDIPVTKQWVGPAASSVTINLLADGVTTETVVLNEENNWQHTFEGLAVYDSTDGHEIVYDVQEEPVEGYEPSRSGTVETGFTFTNTITGKVSIPVTKVWIGPEGESVTVELYAGETKVDEAELNKGNNWQYTFLDLEKYENGEEIAYSIREQKLAGYSTEITANEDGSYTVTNTNVETLDIPVTKQWVGPAANAVTINLLADGTVIDTVMLNAAGNWQHTFEGLAVYDSTDGHEITYTVTEEAVRGYTTKITGDVETGFLVTNTSVVTPPTPKTGDDSNLQLYLGLMLASGGAMVWLLAQKKKNKEE